MFFWKVLLQPPKPVAVRRTVNTLGVVKLLANNLLGLSNVLVCPKPKSHRNDVAPVVVFGMAKRVPLQSVSGKLKPSVTSGFTLIHLVRVISQPSAVVALTCTLYTCDKLPVLRKVWLALPTVVVSVVPSA